MPPKQTSSSSATAAAQAAKTNHAKQCNPNHPEFQGHQQGYTGKGNKADLDHHAKQLNPNNELFRPRGPK
ncbi:unnamed protein product [Rotaria sp. Silwood2]|nr:unnamed protein product [Rotaria sp. Silwood2]